jgi:hypothetical protein
MRPHKKQSQFRTVEERIKELYDRFDNNKIIVQDLLTSEGIAGGAECLLLPLIYYANFLFCCE